MALTAGKVERLAAWCAVIEGLADVRSKARSEFFGYDEPGTVKYMAQTGELNARERRFMGWFGFDYKLPDGRHPAELAAVELAMSADLADLTSVTKSVQDTRSYSRLIFRVHHCTSIQPTQSGLPPSLRQRELAGQN
jgi:hypothetical protein